MQRRFRTVPLAVLMGAGLFAASREVAADAPIPAYVTVVGRGEILLRVADGSVVPCASSSNKVLFEGPVSAGRTLTFSSATASICYQHTYGSFRKTNWSPSFVSTVGPQGTINPKPLIQVVVSTEKP